MEELLNENTQLKALVQDFINYFHDDAGKKLKIKDLIDTAERLILKQA